MKDFIVCIGFSGVDILIRGFESVDKSKEQTKVDQITMWVGGDAMNEAYVLSKLENKVKLMTGLGDDAPADFIRCILDKSDIDYSLSCTRKNTTTSIAIPIVYKDAERGILTPGLGDSLDFYMDPAKIKGAKVVSLGSLFFPPLSNEENTLQIVKQAKANGSIVCADMMWTDHKNCTLEKYKEVWPYIDYFFPNQEEAHNLTGKDTPEEMAHVLLEHGVKNVVIKIGKRGCMVKNTATQIVVPPFLVEAKDTTGAGDNFMAGFITGLMEDKDLEECCRYANAAASIAIQSDGASTGIKDRAQLQYILDNREKVIR